MDLPDTRYEMTKYGPIPPPLSDRNESIRRFSTDRKLTSDIQRRETFAQTIAKFAQTFYRDSLSPLIVLNARINRIVKPGLNRRVKPCARTTCAALDGVENRRKSATIGGRRRHDRSPGCESNGRRPFNPTAWRKNGVDDARMHVSSIAAGDPTEATPTGAAATHRNAPPPPGRPRSRHHAAASPAVAGAQPPPSARYSAIAFASRSALSRISSCPDSYVLRCASSSSRYVATPPA